jgi:hypothetical protein
VCGARSDDLHLVWIGLASTAATCLCAGAVLSMLHFASPERQDSLAAVIAVMAAPSGSDLNPARLDGRIQAPSVPENGLVYATLERSVMDGDLVVPLSAIVTREGRVSGLELLNKWQDGREVTNDCRGALARTIGTRAVRWVAGGRQPRVAGSRTTTVKGKARS